MVGGVHIAIALASLARTLGFHTVVIDPRRAFGNQERFSHADRLIQAWPQEAFDALTLTRSTAVAMLTHDPKIDDPALMIVLDSPVFYVGALGSRNTHAKRLSAVLRSRASRQKSLLACTLRLDWTLAGGLRKRSLYQSWRRSLRSGMGVEAN